ncbi:MAG TPA: hypothetical protein VES39_11240 [Rhodospirillales bacterium]|nr:hypothetical protein [Rhodospirillales bacterium]
MGAAAGSGLRGGIPTTMYDERSRLYRQLHHLASRSPIERRNRPVLAVYRDLLDTV